MHHKQTPASLNFILKGSFAGSSTSTDNQVTATISNANLNHVLTSPKTMPHGSLKQHKKKTGIVPPTSEPKLSEKTAHGHGTIHHPIVDEEETLAKAQTNFTKVP